VRKIIFALAFGALLLPDYGFTLGMGEIEVTTALNQELKAEIQLLSAAPEDVESLIVKLASREEFNRAGIDRPYLLNSLRFSAEVRDGVPLILVTSQKPIREPFLNFLVEIDWPKGHMMREYTILLDPPVFMQQQAPVQQEQSRPAAMESSRPAAGAAVPPQSDSGFRPAMMGAGVSASSAAAPGPEPARVPVPMAVQQQTTPAQAAPIYRRSFQPPSGYRIKQGDTLWSLADSMRPDQTVSIQQMMLAMLRSNPEAFINENVNGLKRGYILRIPDRDDIIAINQAEAVAMVKEQHALWREYQQAMVAADPVSAIESEADSGESIGIDEGGDARLEILAAGTGVSASGSKDPTAMTSTELRAELAIARESLETERVEKEELNQRVQSLEGQVDRMKSLLTLEDSDLAEMQQAATPADVETMPVVEDVEEPAVDEEIEMAVDEVADEADAMLEELTATDEAVEEIAIEEGTEEELFVDAEQDEVLEEMMDQPAAATEDFSVAPTAEPAFMQQQKQGPLASFLNNPLLLAAAGGGLLVILLLIALIIKRRKGGGEEDLFVAGDLDDVAGEVEDSAFISELDDQLVEPVVAEPEIPVETAQEETELGAATEAVAEADTVETPAAEAEDDQEPRDDVIAEADVYLAYGIYQQAEELLQNALKNNPDKDNYRVKLAETYAAGKNTDAFIELATEMHQRSGGQDSPAWQKIVAIGKQMVPDHALFTGDADGGLTLDEPASSAPASADEDSTNEQEALAPDLDLSFDEPETKAEEAASEPIDSVEFDLNETGVDITPEAADEGGVEFDLAETQVLDPQETEEEFSLDIEASELGIEDEAEKAAGSADEFALDLSSEAEDQLSSDDASAGAEMSLDDINEESLEFDVEEAQVDTVSAVDEIGDDLDLSDLDDVDEVSTKLDLAKAYLDMGDADGTRSILDEVMSEGNDDQKREADDLLRQLG